MKQSSGNTQQIQVTHIEIHSKQNKVQVTHNKIQATLTHIPAIEREREREREQ